MRALWFLLLVAACGQKQTQAPCPEPKAPAPAPAVATAPADTPIAAADVAAAKTACVAKHGEANRAAIERGVDQVASMWRASDGDLAAFCVEQFVPDGKAKDALFERLQDFHE
ncbi:MAG TPA: hypothetical protein VFS15_12165, partial [Kofleriaceae bacterium]|nr:hypothetical protein [Kofleriaceae bacterium]